MKPTNKFWTDWTAIGLAVAGMVLMAFTIVWRINPVEGSVIPDFLKNNVTGEAVLWILLISCMPVWTITVALFMWFPGAGQNQWALACGTMIVFQGILYFLIGKGVSVCLRALRRKRVS